jgi:hypothetical protein
VTITELILYVVGEGRGKAAAITHLIEKLQPIADEANAALAEAKAMLEAEKGESK